MGYRRSVLKTIGAGASLGTMSIVGRADDMVEVVMEWKGDDPHVTRAVPRRWLNYVQKVKRVKQRLEQKHQGRDGVFDVRVSAGEKQKGGKRVTKVEFLMGQGADQREVPKQSEGVPVVINEREHQQDRSRLLTDYGCANNDKYNSLWGGVHIQTTTDEDGGVDRNGTVGCVCYRNGKQHAITANHLFNPDIGNCTANFDDEAWQHSLDPDQYLGDVTRYNQERDYAIIELETINGLDYIRNSDPGGEIVSHVSETRLQELVTNDTTVERIGAKSGAKKGEIQKDGVSVDNGCVDLNGNGIQCSADAGQGDSGGPVYTESESEVGKVTIIGLVSGTRRVFPSGTAPCNNDPIYASFFGPPVYLAADQYNLTFGS